MAGAENEIARLKLLIYATYQLTSAIVAEQLISNILRMIANYLELLHNFILWTLLRTKIIIVKIIKHQIFIILALLRPRVYVAGPISVAKRLGNTAPKERRSDGTP